MPGLKHQRATSTKRPDVIVDFIFDNGLLFISIENIGDRPALDVTTQFDPKFAGLNGNREISAMPLFRNIEFLAPHKSIRTLLDSSSAYFSRNEPARISARISYHDSSRKRYTVTIHHNLEIYRDISYVVNSKEEQDGRTAR